MKAKRSAIAFHHESPLLLIASVGPLINGAIKRRKVPKGGSIGDGSATIKRIKQSAVLHTIGISFWNGFSRVRA